MLYKNTPTLRTALFGIVAVDRRKRFSSPQSARQDSGSPTYKQPPWRKVTAATFQTLNKSSEINK